MACCYERVIGGAERRCLGAWRAELLADLDGEVLEIGAGTGINLGHYPSTVRRLHLCEPEPAMRGQLDRRLRAHAGVPVSVIAAPAERLPLADASIDHAVSTLVLCSVTDLAASLAELHRVLRPGGSLRFMEHVHAEHEPRVARWQRRLEPVWRWLSGNCHLTRDTARAIRTAGFELTRLEQTRMIGAPAIVRPMIVGVGRRPD